MPIKKGPLEKIMQPRKEEKGKEQKEDKKLSFIPRKMIKMAI